MTTLTSRQEQVARYVACAYSNKQIAYALEIHIDTVYYNLERIADAWGLDPQRDIRVQITHRLLNAA